MRKAPPSKLPASFHELTVTGIDGEPIQMKAFSGKYVLCVNVASKCGFTPQYKGLQELYEKYQDKLVVIGFPCNQFLMQEPGNEEEIATFCEVNYGVTFPLTEKIKVKGSGQHPVYAWLTQKELNGVSDAKIGWNFNKFLISPEGEWLAHFPSKVEPMSEEIETYLQ
ncbi:MAG: glutathione peroxidase [Phaeodactylibacter sp.]|nr:glutathione peroxidase [Phaeodactylibacter sp.]